MAEFVPSLFLHTFPSGRQCLATSAQSIADCVGMRHGEILRMARNIYTPRQSDGAFLASNIDFTPGSGSRIRGISFSEIGCGNFLRLAGSRSRKMKAAFEKADELFTAAFRAAAREIASASGVAVADKPKAEPEPELKVQRLPIDEPEQKQEEPAPAPAETEQKTEELSPEEEAALTRDDCDNAADCTLRRAGRPLRKFADIVREHEMESKAPWSKMPGDDFFDKLHAWIDSMTGEKRGDSSDALRGAAFLSRPRHVSSRVAEVRELTHLLEYRGYDPKQAVSIAIDTVYGWPTRPIGGSRSYRP